MRGRTVAFAWLIGAALAAHAAGAAKPVLECPKVMAHHADPAAHPGWAI